MLLILVILAAINFQKSNLQFFILFALRIIKFCLLPQNNCKQDYFMHHYLLQEQRQQTQQLELSVKCFNLINETQGIPLDSFIVAKLIEKNKPIKQLVKSKVYWGCSNPEYEEKFNLQFSFKNQQNLLIQVFSNQAKPRLYGWLQTTVSKIFGSRTKMLQDSLKIQNKQKIYTNSKIQVACKKKQKSRQQIICWRLKLRSIQIKPLKTYYFFQSKSPIFFILAKTSKNSQTLIYKSESTPDLQSHQYKQFPIRKKIFQQNYSQFSIKIYQSVSPQKQQLIGSAIVSPLHLQLKKPQKMQVKNQTNSKVGLIQLQLTEQFAKYSFTDYLDAGLQFKVVCNIDFTASNKKCSDADSLHRIVGGASAYEEAMHQTLKILLDYDDDKLIPTYGFGAKVNLPNFNTQGKVSHCFPLNGDPVNPNLKELDGVIRAYRKSLGYLQFSGPTNFSQIIKNGVNQCTSFCSNLSQYMLVFIMTDGQLHDIYPVIDLIDKYSHLPMSIIIVGLGENDFDQMQKLDGDVQPLLNSRGKKVRDIVQFVDFKGCRNSSTSLAVSILQQLPQQVLSFYNDNNITPSRLKQIKTQKQKSQLFRLQKKCSSENKENHPFQKKNEKKTAKFLQRFQRKQ